MMKIIAILATLDTKAVEAEFMRQEIRGLGGDALIIDTGVVGKPGIVADISREQVIAAAGGDFAELLKNPTREKAQPLVTAGATKLLTSLVAEKKVHAVVTLGGTQGTSTCAPVLRALPYGFPKVMLSTAASGDVGPFVGIKDITMMFSVSDILGLNVFSRKILANAVAAAWGMAQIERDITKSEAKGVIGMSNLGVLTKGAIYATQLFENAGYEVIAFHAIGAGGEAMEQMMKEGIITGVFDYAMGEIADATYHALRASGEERLTVAGKLGIPQVLCPGGSEHLGILTQVPHLVPEGWEENMITWHSPVVFVPRPNKEQQHKIAENIGKRLQYTTKNAVFMMPLKGVSSYSAEGGELYNPELDAAYWESLQQTLPKSLTVETHELTAEDPKFVELCVNHLITMMESNPA
jgi:uncharacterized protein (UPF0261 family)